MYQDKKCSIDYNSACGFIQHLNTQELKQVLNDDNKFDEIIKDFKQLKDIDTEKEMLLVSNRSLAEYNLSREPALLLAKQQLKELSETGEALCRNIESKLCQQSGTRNLENALDQLKLSASEMEEESEHVAEQFLNGDTDVEGFLDQFASKRKIMHLRRVKVDKMSEMVLRRTSNTGNMPLLNNGGNEHSFYQPPPPLANFPYSHGSITAMPLPTSYSMPSQF